MHQSYPSLPEPDIPLPRIRDFADSGRCLRSIEGSDEVEFLEEDDGDDSIDMLAQARELDPEIPAAKDQQFEMEIEERTDSPVRSSAATVNDDSVYTSQSREFGGSSAMSE